MKRLSYLDVAKSNLDAGIYREYITQNYGSVLEFGGLSNIYSMARRHCKKLAQIVGKTEEEVVNDIREDYRNMEEAQ